VRPSAYGVALLVMGSCSCPVGIVSPSRDRSESVGLFATPVLDGQGHLALAVRLENLDSSSRTVWVGKPGTGNSTVAVDIFDTSGSRVPQFCPGVGSSRGVAEYVVLNPGDFVEAAVQPWCPELPRDAPLVMQARWWDGPVPSVEQPDGATYVAGPLVAPLTRYDPSSVSTQPDWSHLLDM